jgi:hypothetical protein
MKNRRGDSIIHLMIEPDEFVLCEHEREPADCPACAPVEREAHYLDAEAVRALDTVPPALIGVPFS